MAALLSIQTLFNFDSRCCVQAVEPAFKDYQIQVPVQHGICCITYASVRPVAWLTPLT